MSASDEHHLRLGSNESGQFLFRIESVCSYTLFEGDPPLEFLRTRVQEIVECNPWLAGRLVQTRDALVVSHGQVATQTFHVAESTGLTVDSDVSEVNAALTPYFAKTGAQCVGKDEPLFSLTVVPHVAGNRPHFGVLVSMNHLLGDGHTYYRIYGMLSDLEKPYALTATRSQTVNAEAADFLGKPQDLFSRPGIALGTLRRLVFRKPGKGMSKFINREEIQRIKDEHALKKDPTAPYISTNDILTAWFFENVAADSALMAVNLRDRVPSITQIHSGNYENFVCFDSPRKGLLPADVRRSLRHPKRQVPSFWNSMFGCSAVITNWASIDSEIHLSGSTQVSHFPLGDEGQVPFDRIAVVFRPTRDTLAMFFICDPSSNFDDEKLFCGDFYSGTRRTSPSAAA